MLKASGNSFLRIIACHPKRKKIKSTSPSTMDATTTALSLFQFAIDTLGNIQLATQFKDDFETFQLKLDILRLRLSRWGEIAGFGTSKNSGENDKAQQNNGEDGSNRNAIVALLESISATMRTTQRRVGKMQRKLQQDNSEEAQVLDPELHMPFDLKSIRSRFMDFLRRRRVKISTTIEAVKWVFYKQDQFNAFVKTISELLDGLDKLIPEDDQKKLRQLSDEECRGIDRAYLQELKDIIDGCDPWLEGSLIKGLETTDVSTIINQSRNTGHTVGVHNGNNNGVTNGSESTQHNTFHTS